MKTFTEVSREEYLAFINDYPNQLEFDCTGICEPPLGSYNDFHRGQVWPESMVAKESREWRGPNGEEDSSIPGKYWKYFILKTTQPEKQWWVVDREANNLKQRGPFKHEETAEAVRAEMERTGAFDFSNLWVTSLPSEQK